MAAATVSAQIASPDSAREERDEPANEPAVTSGTPSVPRDGASREEIIDFVRWSAREFGANETVMEKIAEYESSFKVDAVNDWDSNARAGNPSKGLMQFIVTTFDWLAPKAQAARPELFTAYGEPEWMDWRHQALVASWAVANGYGDHWATYDEAQAHARKVGAL